MKVQHLNCGTMRPWATPDGLVCHVLLVETGNGLTLIDTGIGTRYGSDPGGEFGAVRFYVRPDFDLAETAAAQVVRLGYQTSDVRDIVLTHLDSDHAGGLPDFPHARVHLTAAENRAALHPRGLRETGRYLPTHRAHSPAVVEHTPGRSESWRGFAGATELTDIAPGIVLVPLPGHSSGHAAVAVDAGDRWVLHVGDSFYHHGQIDGSGAAPAPLRLMERVIASDWARVVANHERLTELWTAADPDLVLVNAHCPTLFGRAKNRNS